MLPKYFIPSFNHSNVYSSNPKNMCFLFPPYWQSLSGFISHYLFWYFAPFLSSVNMTVWIRLDRMTWEKPNQSSSLFSCLLRRKLIQQGNITGTPNQRNENEFTVFLKSLDICVPYQALKPHDKFLAKKKIESILDFFLFILSTLSLFVLWSRSLTLWNCKCSHSSSLLMS